MSIWAAYHLVLFFTSFETGFPTELSLFDLMVNYSLGERLPSETFFFTNIMFHLHAEHHQHSVADRVYEHSSQLRLERRKERGYRMR